MKVGLRAIHVLFEDGDLIAINKPAGVASVHDGMYPSEPDLHALLEPKFGRLWPVHRLDHDTSGVIVLARNEQAHRTLSQQFEGREVEKTYHAFIVGNPSWEQHTVNAPLLIDADRRHRTVVDAKRGKPAVTHFRVLQRLKRHALIEAKPETGRTHQVRVHSASLGNPIAVDELYGDSKPIFLSQLKRGYRSNTEEELPLMGRLALHALRLQLAHPVMRVSLDIEAPYPKDFNATLNQLRKLA